MIYISFYQQKVVFAHDHGTSSLSVTRLTNYFIDNHILHHIHKNHFCIHLMPLDESRPLDLVYRNLQILIEKLSPDRHL